MAEAQLRIKPTVVGSAAGAVRRDAAALGRLDRQQRSALRSGETSARRLARAYDGIGRSISTAARGVRTISSNIFSLRGAIVGTLTAGAGKTFIEQTIGRADQTNRATKILGAVLKDQTKVNQAVAEARNLTKEIASLDVGMAIQGIEKTITLAGGSVDKAKELVKVAKALESSQPGQSFEDALFALKELESGDVMSLRSRFNIRMPTRAEAEKAAKKAKKTLSQFYFDELIGFMDTRFGDSDQRLSGINALLDIDRGSLSGQVGMVKTEISSLLEEIGKDASKVATNEMPKLVDEIQRLKADPQFRSDMIAISKALADGAKSSIEIARALPTTIREIRDFVKEHSTLLKIGGGALAGNYLTGGGLGRGAASLAGAGGRRLLFGRGGGGAGAGVAGALAGTGGATPVYVVNMGPGGMGGGGFLGRTSKVLGSAGPMTTAGLLKSGGLMGAAGSIGAGGALGLLAIPAAFGAGLLTLQKATEGTSSALENLTNEATRRERQASTPIRSSGERVARESAAEVRSFTTGDFRTKIDRAWVTQDQGEKSRLAQEAVAGVASRLRSKKGDERAATLAALNEELAGLGVEANFNRDKLNFGVASGAEGNIKERGDIVSRELNSVPQVFQTTINYRGTGDPEDDGRKLMKGMHEQARREAKIGPG